MVNKGRFTKGDPRAAAMGSKGGKARTEAQRLWSATNPTRFYEGDARAAAAGAKGGKAPRKVKGQLKLDV